MGLTGQRQIGEHGLPQLSGDFFLTDSGLETTLIVHEGFDLPEFAPFDLLKDEPGVTVLRDYYRTHAAIARRHGVGVILESATWRSSPGWRAKLGYSTPELKAMDRKAIQVA